MDAAKLIRTLNGYIQSWNSCRYNTKSNEKDSNELECSGHKAPALYLA